MTIDELKTIYKAEEIVQNAPMSDHTSFKIGGPADFLLMPRSVTQIKKTIERCQHLNMPYYVVGNGSNILVDDDGIRGLVIKIGDNLKAVEVKETSIEAEAGVLLSTLSKVALEASLEGLAFASGIPGTLGGAIFMNAGAYGGEMKDVVKWVEVLTPEGQICRLSNAELAFGYRSSLVKSKGYIVLKVALALKKGDYQAIKAEMDDLTQRRVSKQPLEMPSAGSTFKRPEGYFAGKLIEDAGCRGLIYGKAQVSQKHCGFVVNVGGATCHDVMTLIQTVQKLVYDDAGVQLEREVRIFGKE